MLITLDYLLSRVVFLRFGKGFLSKGDPLQVKIMFFTVASIQLLLLFFVDIYAGRPGILQAVYITVLLIAAIPFYQVL